jgi:hypothetical protein
MSDVQLTPEAQLLLLVLASHGGSLTRAEAEAVYARVVRMSDADRDAWIVDAKAKTRTYATLRRAGNA